MLQCTIRASLRLPVEKPDRTRCVPGFGPDDNSVHYIEHFSSLDFVTGRVNVVSESDPRNSHNLVQSQGMIVGATSRSPKGMFKKIPTVESPLLLSSMRYIFRMLLSASVP